MKRVVRIILIATSALILIGGLVLLCAVYVLNQKINSPDFRASIEKRVAKATHCETHIGEMSGHIGLLPWLNATNVNLVFPAKHIQLDVEQIQFQIRALPLFFGDVVFTEIRVIRPVVVVHRFKDGSLPPLSEVFSKGEGDSKNILMENIVLENARFTFIDETKSPDPLIELKMEAALSRSIFSRVAALKVEGTIQSQKIRANLDVDGQFNAETMPLTWVANAHLTSPVWLATKQSLPVSVNAVCASSGPLSVAMNWNSTGTKFNVAMAAPEWSHPSVDLQLSGSKWDGQEMKSLDILPAFLDDLKMEHGALAASVHKQGPQWKMDLAADDISWRETPMEKIQAHFIWDGKKFEGQNVHGVVSSGTVSGQFVLDNWKPSGFQSFITSGTLRNVEMGPVFFSFSTNPVIVAGRLSSDFKFSGALPFTPGALNGGFTVTGQSGYFRSGKVIADVLANINLNSLFKTVSGRKRYGLPFDIFTATTVITNGVMQFDEPVVVKGPGLEMAYRGYVHVDFNSGKGTLVVNPLVGSRNLVKAIPGISQLIIGPSGEFLPLIVNVSFKPGKIEKKFSSMKTLAAPVMRIIGNIFRLPSTIIGKE